MHKIYFWLNDNRYRIVRKYKEWLKQASKDIHWLPNKNIGSTIYFSDRIKDVNIVNIKSLRMMCTLSKCWPNSLVGPCDGDLRSLDEYSFSPASHLSNISSFHKKGENPEHMWQVWLTSITASTLSVEEIQNFTVCDIHKASFSSSFFLLMTWTRFNLLNLNFRTILSRGFQQRQLGILESAVSVRQSLDWGMWTTSNTRNASRNLPWLSKLEPVTILDYFLMHLSLKNYRIVYDLPNKAVCAKWKV